MKRNRKGERDGLGRLSTARTRHEGSSPSADLVSLNISIITSILYALSEVALLYDAKWRAVFRSSDICTLSVERIGSVAG